MNQTDDEAGSALVVEYDGEVAIINASGDLTGSRDRIESAMTEVLERGFRLVVIDFSEATRIDTEGFADFTAALIVADDRDANVAGVSPKTKAYSEELILRHIEPLIEFYDTRDEALAALRGEVAALGGELDAGSRFRSIGWLVLVGALMGLLVFFIRAMQ